MARAVCLQGDRYSGRDGQQFDGVRVVDAHPCVWIDHEQDPGMSLKRTGGSLARLVTAVWRDGSQDFVIGRRRDYTADWRNLWGEVYRGHWGEPGVLLGYLADDDAHWLIITPWQRLSEVPADASASAASS